MLELRKMTRRRTLQRVDMLEGGGGLACRTAGWVGEGFFMGGGGMVVFYTVLWAIFYIRFRLRHGVLPMHM
jgi:hypothetical protein